MPSAKVYGGAYDGLVVTFDPGPLPEWIMMDSPAPFIEKTESGTFVMMPDAQPSRYVLEYVDPETMSPLIAKERLADIVAVYVPHPLIELRPVEEAE